MYNVTLPVLQAPEVHLLIAHHPRAPSIFTVHSGDHVYLGVHLTGNRSLNIYPVVLYTTSCGKGGTSGVPLRLGDTLQVKVWQVTRNLPD